MMMIIGKILLFQRRQLHTIISREIIKPSSPTPSHLKTYNISQLDQRSTHVYMPLIFFYRNNEICSLTPDDKAREMKKSLSQSLTRYYPFAGRLHTPTETYVDCNDEGVVFVEAKHDTQLNMFQNTSEEDEIIRQLFLDGMVWQNSPYTESLVAVQLNHFACGGMAAAVSMSHRIGDACTFGSYVSHWASVARHGSIDNKEVKPLNPHFIQSPASTNILAPETAILKPWRCVNPVTRKFVFPNSKLSDLKNKVLLALAEHGTTVYINTTNPRPSSFKPSILVIPVNIRKQLVPKLPQTTVGNFVVDMLVTTRHDSETSLSAVVSQIKKEKMELERVENIDSIRSRLGNDDLENADKRSFWCSSLCRYRYNKTDFEWGKLTVASITYRSSNHIGSVLMDTPNGDGIEAWVTLETQDMKDFRMTRNSFHFAKIN